AYGADVELVEGPRVAAQQEAIRQATDHHFYASHNWQVFFLQGTKTLAYELWEDLGFQAPDNVIVPVGAGSSLLGCWLGFTELFNTGQISRLPRLFAAQPEHCSPVDASFQAHTMKPVARKTFPTVAEGTAIAQPLRLGHMVQALQDTNGSTVAVSEAAIISALRHLCSQGLFVEPTSALAAAAYSMLVEDQTINPDQQTVVLLTGSGLKAASTVAQLLDV